MLNEAHEKNPITFRAPDDVRDALAKIKAANGNVSATIVKAIRKLLKLKAPKCDCSKTK